MSIASHATVGYVRCPQCSTLLLGESWEASPDAVICPGCRGTLFGRIYPAVTRSRPEGGAGQHAVEGEAVCFFHPDKRAALCCERCGRFVCELCDMPLGGKHLCPACLGSGIEKEKLPELVNKRWVWSRMALIFGILPLIIPLFWFLYFVTGPATIAFALYGWNKPGSIVRGPRRWMAMIAVLLGLIQLAVIGGMVILMWKSSSHA